MAVGKTLRADTGEWRGYGVRFSFAWESCRGSSGSCKAVRGASSANYVVQPGDAGRRLRVQVTASTLTLSASAKSAPTSKVAGKVAFSFPLAGSGSDGYVSRFESPEGATPTEVETKTGTIVVARSVRRRGVLVSVGLLRFDTSVIPANARITSVKLQFQTVFAFGGGGLRLVVEPYPSERRRIDARDFATQPQQPPVGSVALASLRSGYRDSIRLGTRAVQKGSVSWLRLLVPGGLIDTENSVVFAAVDHPDLPAPSLVVTYSIG